MISYGLAIAHTHTHTHTHTHMQQFPEMAQQLAKTSIITNLPWPFLVD